MTSTRTAQIDGLEVEDEPLTDHNEITWFRSQAARANYLSQDRPELMYAAKEVCRDMSAPRVSSQRGIKRIVRFLAHRPRLVWKYDFQPEPEEIVVFSDANWANCSRSRKSTSGGCVMYATHLLRSW